MQKLATTPWVVELGDGFGSSSGQTDSVGIIWGNYRVRVVCTSLVGFFILPSTRCCVALYLMEHMT